LAFASWCVLRVALWRDRLDAGEQRLQRRRLIGDHLAHRRARQQTLYDEGVADLL